MSIATADNFKPTNPKPFSEWELYPVGDGTYRHWASTTEITNYFAGANMSPSWAKYKFFWIAGVYHFYTGNEFIPIGAPGNVKGIAYTNTVPAAGATIDAQYIYFSGPGTFANFPDENGQPIVLTEVLNVISWDGTKATVQAVPAAVDTSDLVTKEEIQPTTDYVDEIKAVLKLIDGKAFVIDDESGNEIMRIDADSTANFYKVASLIGISAPEMDVVSFKISQFTNGVLCIDDEQGNMICKIDENGKLINLASLDTSKRNLFGFQSKVIHFLLYGQSNNDGGDVIAHATTEDIPFAYTFKEGARTASLNGVANPKKLTTFVPLSISSSSKEIPCYGLADEFSRLISKTGGLSLMDETTFLHSTAAVGSSSIDSLKKGTTTYNDLLSSVKCAFDNANGDYAVSVIPYAQGEADFGHKTGADWLADTRQMFSDLNTDIKAITGQKEDVRFLVYQNIGLQTATMTSTNEIPLALVELMMDENVHPICPFYIFEFKNTQSSHLITDHYKYFGAYMGLACKRVLIDGINLKPIVPREYIQVDATTIDIIYRNVMGHLVIDSDWVTDPGGYGYNFTGGVDVESVEVISSDRIRIKTSAAYVGETLNYGLQGLVYNGRTAGNRGCIRDNSGYENTYTSSDGGVSPFPLHNWVMMHTTNL